MSSYAIETHLLHRRRFNLEVRDDIAPKDTCLQSLHVTTNVGLRSHKMSLIHSAVRLFVPVGHDNLSSESFDLEQSSALSSTSSDRVAYHQQRFAESSTSFPQDFVRLEWNNVAKRKDERMDVFHVEVVRGNRIGNGVLSEYLWLFHRIPAASDELGAPSCALVYTHGVMSSGSSSIGS